MAQIVAYLFFDGNCREAMEFYKESLGGDLAIQTVRESPVAGQLPAEAGEKIMHARLTAGDLTLLASDAIGQEHIIGNNISLTLLCDSEEEIQTHFSKLSAGGKVTHPLRVEFWGATYGQLTDKFGINWMLNYDKK